MARTLFIRPPGPALVLRVRIETPIHPTEDPAKVEAAVKAIFPDAELARDERWVTGTGENLDILIKKAGEERVMDAARGALWRGRIDEHATRFEINKQAAAVGRVNFNEVTHPLGDITVTLESDDDLDALLDRIAPPTPAELRAAGRGSAAARAEVHREEATVQALGTKYDAWDEVEAPWPEGADDGVGDDDEDYDEEEDYDPLGRRKGPIEED